MNLAAIRSNLAALIDNISGLSVVPRITDSVNPPVAIIEVGDGVYDESFDGLSTVGLSVLLLVSKAGDASEAQLLLDQYLNSTGTKSVRAAIDADQTLGGTVDSTRVAGWVNYNGSYSASNIEYAGVEIQVEVYV